MSLRPAFAQNSQRTPSRPLASLNEVLSIGMYKGNAAAASGESDAMVRYKTFFYIASLKGFLEMEKGTCRVEGACDGNPKLWETVFSVATTWSPEPGRMNDWAWHVENNIKQGAADAFIQSVRAEADKIRAANSDPSKIAELNKKLSDHYRKAIKQVVMHKVLFGGEYVDIDMPHIGANALKPLGAFFMGQVSTFLSRTNGSIPALVRMVTEWKKRIPVEYVRLIPSDFVEDVFREAVRLSYDPRWNSNMQNVDRAASMIKASWEGGLNRRARIELGLEDDNLNIHFDGLSNEYDTHQY